MKTIAFYSYKGGTGRTLLLANTAKFLAQNNKKVFLLDLDLEAPGLIRKFGENTSNGFVDYLYDKLSAKKSQKIDLRDYIIDIDSNISILSAGNPYKESYVQKMASINWHELYYGKKNLFGTSYGKRFFSELIEKITSFNYDYLLIDSRTGITDIGGLILNYLADEIVCLFLNNNENFEGVSRVINNAINNNKNVYPVLSRFPNKLTIETDEERISIVKSKICSNLDEQQKMPSISIFHSDVGIEVCEHIKYAEDKVLKQSVLLQDYIQFFYRLFPDIINQSELKSYLDLINEGKQYLSTKKFLSDSPYKFIENDRARAEQLKVEGFYLKTIDSVYFSEQAFKNFVDGVVLNLEKQLSLKEISPSTNNINWNLLGFQFISGVFDFCKDIYYLNNTRENLVDILQLGELKSFTILLPSYIDFQQSNTNLGEFIKSLNEYLIEKGKTVENMKFAVIGDQAAATEAYRHLSLFPISDNKFLYENVVIMRNESQINNWIKPKKESGEDRVVIVDYATIEKINMENYNKIILNFDDVIPVGFMYKKNCPNIRYEINKAIANSLIGVNAEQKWSEIKSVLKSKYDIDAFEWNELKINIMWNLKLKESIDWNETLNHGIYENSKK